MNTLSRAFTARLFPSQTEYDALRRHWRELVNSDRRYRLKAVHHLLYSALMGHDWRRGFTPPTNLKKLANNGFSSWRLFDAIHALHSEYYEGNLYMPFGGLLQPPMVHTLRRLIPYSLTRYPESAFAWGRFPFEAFQVPEDWLKPQPETGHV